MSYRYVEAYGQSEHTLTLQGRTYVDPTLVEDDDGYRWFLTSSMLGIMPGIWAQAEAKGAVGLLAPATTFDGWEAVTTEDFIRHRTVEHSRYNFTIAHEFDEPPSYEALFDRPTLMETSRKGFVHLHTHSEMSALDGRSTIKEIVAQARADDQFAVAVTDHGVCSGHPELAKVTTANGMKPIFGMEASSSPAPAFVDRSPCRSSTTTRR
jgi:hypothetical protein